MGFPQSQHIPTEAHHLSSHTCPIWLPVISPCFLCQTHCHLSVTLTWKLVFTISLFLPLTPNMQLLPIFSLMHILPLTIPSTLFKSSLSLLFFHIYSTVSLNPISFFYKVDLLFCLGWSYCFHLKTLIAISFLPHQGEIDLPVIMALQSMTLPIYQNFIQPFNFCWVRMTPSVLHKLALLFLSLFTRLSSAQPHPTHLTKSLLMLLPCASYIISHIILKCGRRKT